MLKSVIVEVTGLRRCTRTSYPNNERKVENYIKISCAVDENGVELDLALDDDKIAGSSELKIGDTILVMLALTPFDKNWLTIQQQQHEGTLP